MKTKLPVPELDMFSPKPNTPVLQQLNLNPIVLRFLIILTSPIWIAGILAYMVLWVLGTAVFLTVGCLLYWIATGTDLTKSKYNIFGI